MKHLEHVAALLFAEDPRAKSEKILSSLIVESDARGGAVLALRNGRLHLFTGQDLPVAQLARVQSAWANHAKALQRGGPSKAETLVLAPLLEGDVLNGVLVLEAPREFDLRETDLLRSLLARALTTTVTPRAETSRLAAETVPGHEIERRRLIDMLQRHEWNIALVARHLGVTRRTVYMRMEKHGIDRLRVPKTLKKSPALP